MRNIVYVGAWTAAVLLTVAAPGRSAEATDCAPAEPKHLFLELESVTVDGVPVEPVDETWAHLEPWDYWRDDVVDLLEVYVEKPWTNLWGLGGQRYERSEK